MSIVSKNLGFIQSIHRGVSAPSNTSMVWVDTSVSPQIHKVYDEVADAWVALAADASFQRPNVQLVFDDPLNPLPATDATQIDGVTVLDGYRVLVLDSFDANQINKIYTASVSAGAITWTVAQDGTGADLPTAGQNTFVEQGSTYGLLQTFFNSLTWVFNDPHQQNTDTGTTSSTFDIDSDATGVRLKNVAGELQLRDLADTGYADLRVGDLVVEGTQTIVNSEIVEIADNIIVLNSNVTSGSPTEDGGIHIRRGSETEASILWNETTDRWTAGLSGSELPILFADAANALSSSTSLDLGNFSTSLTATDFKFEHNVLNDVKSVGVNSTQAYLQANDGTNTTGITADITNGLVITDQILSEGVTYATEYTAPADRTWLTHKGYVDDLVAGSTGASPFEYDGTQSARAKGVQAAGQVTLTNGSGAVSGTGTNFQDNTTYTGVGYWGQIWVNDGTEWHRLFISATSATNASITNAYNTAQIRAGYTSSNGTFQGVSGTYDFYAVQQVADDGWSYSIGNNGWAENFAISLGGGVATGATALAHGFSTLAEGNQSTAFNRYTHATGNYSFTGGLGLSVSVPVLASADASFNFSENTGAQTSGHGALAANSAILGGIDHNIPSDSPRSVILGGSAIKADATLADRVYVPNLRVVGTGRIEIQDTNNYIYSSGLNQIGFATNGSLRVLLNQAGDLYNDSTGAWSLRDVASSATVPTVIQNRSNLNTGLGGAAGEIDLITNSVSRLNITDTAVDVPFGVNLSFGGDTRIYESADNTLAFRNDGGTFWMQMSTDVMRSSATSGYQIRVSASTTNPTYTFRDESGLGIGRSASQQLSIYANSVDVAQFTETLQTFSTVVAGVEPTADEHLATKAYVDRIASQDSKDSAELATTANVTLSGEQTIDGILTSSSRILVKNQTLPAENGIYVTSSGAWTRADDADDDGEMTAGMKIWIDAGGTLNGNTEWTLTTANPIIIGTTGLTFTKTGEAGYIDAQNGLTKNGNFIELGGTLNQLTTINTNGFELAFSGTGGIDVQGNAIRNSVGSDITINERLDLSGNGTVEGIGDAFVFRNTADTGYGTSHFGNIRLQTTGSNYVLLQASPTTTRVITFPDIAGTVMLNLVEDTTPQLGGNLDLQTFSLVGSGVAGTTNGLTLGATTLWLNHATNTGMEIDFGATNPSVRRKDDASGIIFEGNGTYSLLGTGGGRYIQTDPADTVNSPALYLRGQRAANGGATIVFENISATPFGHSTGNQSLLLLNTTVNQSGTASFDWIKGNLNLTSVGDGTSGDGNNIINLTVGGALRLRQNTDGHLFISVPQTATTSDDEFLVRTSTGEIKQRNISDIAGDHTLGSHSDTDFTGVANNDLIYRSAGQWVDTGGQLEWDGTQILTVGNNATAPQLILSTTSGGSTATIGTSGSNNKVKFTSNLTNASGSIFEFEQRGDMVQSFAGNTNLLGGSVVLNQTAGHGFTGLSISIDDNSTSSGNINGITINYDDAGATRSGTNRFLNFQDTGVPRFEVSTTGAITAGDGLDINHTFGQVAVGSPVANIAYFAHRNLLGSLTYSLFQNSNGDTSINAVTGRDISFRINNQDQWVIDSSGNLTGSTGKHLSVDGGTIGANIPFAVGGLGADGDYVNIASLQWKRTTATQYEIQFGNSASSSDIIFNSFSDSSVPNRIIWSAKTPNYDQVPGNFTISAAGAWSSATINTTGADIILSGGAGSTGVGTDANGGNAYLQGGAAHEDGFGGHAYVRGGNDDTTVGNYGNVYLGWDRTSAVFLGLPATATTADDEFLVRTSTGEIKQRNISDIAGDHTLGSHSDTNFTGIAASATIYYNGTNWLISPNITSDGSNMEVQSLTIDPTSNVNIDIGGDGLGTENAKIYTTGSGERRMILSMMDNSVNRVAIELYQVNNTPTTEGILLKTGGNVTALSINDTQDSTFSGNVITDNSKYIESAGGVRLSGTAATISNTAASGSSMTLGTFASFSLNGSSGGYTQLRNSANGVGMEIGGSVSTQTDRAAIRLQNGDFGTKWSATSGSQTYVVFGDTAVNYAAGSTADWVMMAGGVGLNNDAATSPGLRKGYQFVVTDDDGSFTGEIYGLYLAHNFYTTTGQSKFGDSPYVFQRAVTRNTSDVDQNSDWRFGVNTTADNGASEWRLQQRLGTAAFGNKLWVQNNGNLTAAGDVISGGFDFTFNGDTDTSFTRTAADEFGLYAGGNLMIKGTTTDVALGQTPSNADIADFFLFRDGTNGNITKLSIGTGFSINAGALDAAGGANSFETHTVTDTDSGYTWAETGSAVATVATDTLTWVSGSGIDIDVDATSQAIRISTSGAGGLTSAYTSMTDGTTTSTASGSDTFKFRSADTALTVAVTNDDVTHGDNVLFTINEANFSGIPNSALTNSTISGVALGSNLFSLTAGVGIAGSAFNGSAAVTWNLDFSELTDMTGNISGATEFIVQDGTTESRKAASEIQLSFFNNDSAWTSNTGDVTLSGVQTITGAKTFNDGTLLLDDSDSLFNLQLRSTSTITTADKILTFDVNDANRTLTISGDATVSGTNSGDQTATLTAGTGLAGTTYDPDTNSTFSLAVDELSEKTGALVGTDRLTGTSGTTNFSETISGIPLSIFNNDSGWTNNAGTVTSVAMSVPTGFTIGGSPITTSGTLALAFDTGYSLPTDASQSNWDAAYNDKINSASFNTGTGVLTLTQQDTGTVTVDLDGRYLTSETDSQTLSWTASTNNLAISNGNSVTIDTFTDVLTINGNASNAGRIRITEQDPATSGNNYIEIISPTSLSANRTLTLPDATGTLMTLWNFTTDTVGTEQVTNGEVITFVGGTDMDVTHVGSTITVAYTGTGYTLPLAADGTRGGIQIGYVENAQNYPVELASEKAFVNVPWTDTATAADDILEGTNTGTQITYAPYTARTEGSFYINVSNPISTTTHLKFDGEFSPTRIYLPNAPDTALAATHYYVETGGANVLPKTLANVRTEIVTTAAVDAAKADIVTGTGTDNQVALWNGTNAIDGSTSFTVSGTTMTINTLALTNDLDETHGGTGRGTYTVGDILYSNATNALTVLSAPTGTTTQYRLEWDDNTNTMAWVDSPLVIKRANLRTTDTTTDLSTGAWVAIPWDSQNFIDSDVYTHSTSVNNSRLEVEEDGVYRLRAVLGFTTNQTGQRVTLRAAFRVNGTTIQTWSSGTSYNRGTTYGNSTVTAETTISLSANDYVEVIAINDVTSSTYNATLLASRAEFIAEKVSDTSVANTWRPITDTPAADSGTSISAQWANTFTISDVNDVTITTIASGELLKWNGSAWVNNTLAEAGIEPTVTKGNLTETTSSVLTIGGGTGAVIGAGTTIEVAAASTSTSGYLSSTDWNTFDGKITHSGTTAIYEIGVYTADQTMTGYSNFLYADTTRRLQMEGTSAARPNILGFVDTSLTTADVSIYQIQAAWGVSTTSVASIDFKSGADTTNKDDGRIVMYTANTGSLAERYRIDENGLHTLTGTLNLASVPSTDVGFSTSRILVRDTSGNVDALVAAGTSTGRYLKDDGTWDTPTGGGTIGGSIATDQVAVGSAADTIEGTTGLTYTANTTLSVTGGITLSGDIRINGGNAFQTSNTSAVRYGGGNAASAGSWVEFRGGAATNPNDITFGADSTTVLQYDHSATSWDFQANDLTTTGGIDAADFNGVALTTAGSATTYLNGQGNYTTAIGGTIATDQIAVGSGTDTITGVTSLRYTDTTNSQLSVDKVGIYYGRIDFGGNTAYTTAGGQIGSIGASWATNGTPVSRIAFLSGNDTTNKDEGKMAFYTTNAGGVGVTALTIEVDGEFIFNNNVGGGGSTNFLRADGQWAAPTGQITGSGVANRMAYWDTTNSIADADDFVRNATGQYNINNTGGIALLELNSTTSSSAVFYYASGGSTRWTAEKVGTESGSNAGSNYRITRYSDAGSSLEIAFEINRATGKIDINGELDLNNNPITAGTSITATSFVKSGGTSSQFLKADGSVDSSTYLTGNQTITLSGDVTGSGTTAITTAIAANTIGTSEINATGTPSSSTFLRGDMTWAATGGVTVTGTPSSGEIAIWNTSTELRSSTGLTYSDSTTTQLNVKSSNLFTGFTVENTSTSSAYNAGQTIKTGSGGGDPYLQWNVNDVRSYGFGIDNSDADQFKFTTGTASAQPSSGTEIYNIASTGLMTWVTNGIRMNTNIELYFGTTGGSDAYFYHSGTHFYLRQQAEGNFYLMDDATIEFTFDLSGTGTGDATGNDWIATSDVRLKTNIRKLEDWRDQIAELGKHTVRYERKKALGTDHIGFIAQEVKPIVPEFVNFNEDSGYYGINYSKLIAPAIQVIAQNIEMLDNHETRLEKLERELEEHKEEIRKLKDELYGTD